MAEDKRYVLEIPEVRSEETTVYLEADARTVKSLFAIVEVSDGGASIVDNYYRAIDQAQSAWPDAFAPKPFHLTPNAIEQNCTIHFVPTSRKLR